MSALTLGDRVRSPYGLVGVVERIYLTGPGWVTVDVRDDATRRLFTYPEWMLEPHSSDQQELSV